VSEAASVKISDVHFDPPLDAADLYADIETIVDDGMVASMLEEARREVSGLLAEPKCATTGASPAAILESLSHCGVVAPDSAQAAAGHADIVAKLAQATDAQMPVEFVLSLFPCKGCHPLRTLARSGSEIDFGDVVCLVRLVRLIAAVSRVHRHGARITILSNGRRYSDVFFEQRSDVDLYRSNIRDLIRFLGCEDVIRLADEDVLYTEEYRHEIGLATAQAEMDIRRQPAAYADMIRNIELNLNPPLRLVARDYAEIVRQLDAPRDMALSDVQRAVLAFIRDNAITSTARYIATNKVLRDLRLIEDAYPNHIKLTVHAKPGQIAIVPVGAGSAFPHNGQAFLRAEPALDNVAVKYSANFLRMKGVHLRGIVLPRREFSFANDTHPFVVWAQEGNLR
jgi:pyoverdine/dityrosine biosynthesis protein Dit1